MGTESSIKDIINNSLDQIRSIVDANTVMGTPINTPSGTTIIPVSKLSIGFASGGLDNIGKEKNKKFGGGGGTGVTLVPLGIITVSPLGAVDMIPMTQDKSSPIEQVTELLENAPAILERFKNVLDNVMDKEKEDDEDEALADEIPEELQATVDETILSHLTDKELRQLQRIQEKAERRAAKKLTDN
ncbi:MAG: hypothetical protein IKC31_02645 [Clostridia bacterium]|nr:hypothetical protein [Clostridia bacterium]MBR2926458.1 hypothetical protein [Clostridia bacterium]